MFGAPALLGKEIDPVTFWFLRLRPRNVSVVGSVSRCGLAAALVQIVIAEF